MRNDVLDSINRILAETEGHTPGPWGYKAGVTKHYAFSTDPGEDFGVSLQEMHWQDGREVPAEANARLIAAAPDMRALLERVGSLLGQLHPLAVTASSSTGTASEVRAARDTLVKLCLELGAAPCVCAGTGRVLIDDDAEVHCPHCSPAAQDGLQ